MSDKKISVKVSQAQLSRLRAIQDNYFTKIVSKIPGTSDPTAIYSKNLIADDECLIHDLIEAEINRTEEVLEKLLASEHLKDFLK